MKDTRQPVPRSSDTRNHLADCPCCGAEICQGGDHSSRYYECGTGVCTQIDEVFRSAQCRERELGK